MINMRFIGLKPDGVPLIYRIFLMIDTNGDLLRIR